MNEIGIQSVKTERVMIMKNLRLVFDNINGERKDITLPMEKWISDWLSNEYGFCHFGFELVD